jgi:sugar phosphate isomerase/epimerase
MELGLSTYLFVNQRLSSHILDQILGAGIRQIEIFAAKQHLDYHDAHHVRDIAQWFTDHDVKLHSIHMPLIAGLSGRRSGGLAISTAYAEKRYRTDSMDELKRAIEVAERLPFRFFIIHLGVPGEDYDMRKFDAAFTTIEYLRLFAKERGAQILIENIPNALSTPERLVEFIQYTRLDLKICFDTGHAHLDGDVVPSFEAVKHLVSTVHLHDNRREGDDHLLPFAGTIAWEPAIQALRGLDAQIPFLIEPRDYGPQAPGLPKLGGVIQKIRDVPAPEPKE